MKITCHFYIVFQVLKVLLKSLYDTPISSFICYCFALAFTSADIIFHNFFELHSVLTENKFLSQILVSFSNGFTNPHHRLNGQNLLSVTKFLVDASL